MGRTGSDACLLYSELFVELELLTAEQRLRLMPDWPCVFLVCVNPGTFGHNQQVNELVT